MAAATMPVVTVLRRKKNSTPVASTAPMTPACSSPSSELRMSSPWSVKVSTRMPLSIGSSPVSLSTRRARSATATVLAPDSLTTFRPMARPWSRCRP